MKREMLWVVYRLQLRSITSEFQGIMRKHHYKKKALRGFGEFVYSFYSFLYF